MLTSPKLQRGDMMTRLSQVLAIEKGLKTQRRWIDAHRRLQKPQLLAGISRTYTPIDDEGEQLPAESTRVQVTVEEEFLTVIKELTRLFDIVGTKELGNTEATASIVLEDADEPLLPNVPVTYLLFLEKQLTDLREFVAKLPILDPAEVWLPDATSGRGWVTEAVQTLRTRKVPKNHVKAPATDKHPAQVDVYHEDVTVGRWSTRRFSGAIPAARAAELLDRVEKLQRAVKKAREEANTLEVDEVLWGPRLLGYVFA